MKENKKFIPHPLRISFSCALEVPFAFAQHAQPKWHVQGVFGFCWGWIQGLLNLKALGGWKYTLPETNILLMEEIRLTS